MSVNEIPMIPDNQEFRITLGDISYTLRVLWRDDAGWIMDVMDSGAQPLLMGVPLVPGVNLLAQYPDLGISGALVVMTDNAQTSTIARTTSKTFFLFILCFLLTD